MPRFARRELQIERRRPASLSHRRADQACQSLARRAPGRAYAVGVGTSPEGRQSERRMTSAPSTTAFTYDELDAILRGAGGHDGAIGIVGLATVQHQPASFNSLS